MYDITAMSNIKYSFIKHLVHSCHTTGSASILHWHNSQQYVHHSHGLKYNFKGGELFSSMGPPVRSKAPHSFPGPVFSSGLSNYEWWTECIKHDFMLFFQYCKIL